MSTADLVIIALIAFQAWSGLKLGLVMGVFQLIVMIASLIAALVLEEPVAAMLEGIVSMGPDIRRLAVFAVITTGASFIFNIIGGRILGPLMARQQRSRASRTLDRAFGLVPAALRGLLYAGSLVYMARFVLPPGHDLRTQLDGSALAGFVQTVFETFTPYARML